MKGDSNTPIWLHHANHPPAHQGNTHTRTHSGLLLCSHKVTECRYKCTQPSNKWDLACSINSAAKIPVIKYYGAISDCRELPAPAVCPPNILGLRPLQLDYQQYFLFETSTGARAGHGHLTPRLSSTFSLFLFFVGL